MPTRYNQLIVKELRERGRKMANARWAQDSARRDSEEPERLREMARARALNLPRREGDVLGSLQWTDAGTSKVRRWTVRIGGRCDQVTLEMAGGKRTKSHGWTWVMTQLRKRIVGGIHNGFDH